MDPMSQYIADITRYPLLTKHQEIVLARQMHVWLYDENATPQQKRAGKRAYEKLINCNLRLVVSIAKRYVQRSKRTDLLDIIQEGNLGLAYGLKKFDPERGYALSTYIYWWIRQGITRYLAGNDRMIRLPSGAWEILNKVRYWIPQFQLEHGRVPTIEECAEHCNTTENRMRGYMMHLADCGSSDALIANAKNDSDTRLIDVIACENPGPLDLLEWSLGTESLDRLLSTLKPEDIDMLNRYFGMNGQPASSYSEIGRHYGVTRERIRQRIGKSLLKLRLHSAGISVKNAA
jgi:RNA polymerase primary sigma factor